MTHKRIWHLLCITTSAASTSYDVKHLELVLNIWVFPFPSQNCVHNKCPSEWIFSSEHFICKLGWRITSLLTLRRAQVRQPVQKVGQKENYPVKWKKQKQPWVLRKVFPSTPKNNWQILSQDLLYKRNWAEYSPLLPFLLRPASHYVTDYLGLPYNKQQQQLKSNRKHNNVAKLKNFKSNRMWELTSLTWHAIHKGCHRLVRLNKYLWKEQENRVLLQSIDEMVQR